MGLAMFSGWDEGGTWVDLGSGVGLTWLGKGQDWVSTARELRGWGPVLV